MVTIIKLVQCEEYRRVLYKIASYIKTVPPTCLKFQIHTFWVMILLYATKILISTNTTMYLLIYVCIGLRKQNGQKLYTFAFTTDMLLTMLLSILKSTPVLDKMSAVLWRILHQSSVIFFFWAICTIAFLWTVKLMNGWVSEWVSKLHREGATVVWPACDSNLFATTFWQSIIPLGCDHPSVAYNERFENRTNQLNYLH